MCFKSCFLVVLLLISIGSTCSVAHCDSPTKSSAAIRRIQWAWPIAIATTANKSLSLSARELSQVLGIKLSVLKSEANPTCCFWLTIRPWSPNPGTSGYVIIVQPGGGLITASDAKQMNLAIKRLKTVKKTNNGRTTLPVGLLTNYPLVIPPVTKTEK